MDSGASPILLYESNVFVTASLSRRRAMEHSPLSQEIQECIAECLNCYCTCTQTAMNQCLEEGGDHVQPEHFRLMTNCAQICKTSADFMLGSSPLYAEVCSVCADVCDACAASCERIGGMEDCAQVCRGCAESCREMGEVGRGKAEAAPRRSPETPATPRM
jgi:hypothetical protein